MTDSRPWARALTPQTGDFDHPVHDLLVAYVDGRTDAADSEWIEAHMEVCPTCREDVDDLREVQHQLQPVRRFPRYMMYGTIAAGIALLVWLGSTPAPSRPDAEATVASAAVEAPAPAESPAPASALSGTLSAEDQQRITRALEAGQPTWPAFHAIVRTRAGTLLGDSPRVAPLTPTSPTATAVTSARPEFSWTAGADVTSYEISIYDENFRQVATSGAVSRPGWRPDRDLPRDQVLTWQITAVGPSGTTVSPAPPQPEARFVVLPETTVATITAARARLGNEPLALGIVLAEAGLYQEAETALMRAAADSRYDTAQVSRLVAALRR